MGLRRHHVVLVAGNVQGMRQGKVGLKHSVMYIGHGGPRPKSGLRD